MHAKKLEEVRALHKGKKGTKYKERYAIRIDLSKLDNIASYTDHKKMPSEMSIKERDEIYSRLAGEFPAGTDFAIWVAQYKAGNVASMEIALPKGASDINFKGIDFVMSAGSVKYDGFYLGDPDIQPQYYEIKGWTKKSGLKAINKALRSGTAAEVETTIFFRDKHEFKTGSENPYREVMKYLLDGDDSGYAHIDSYTDQPQFSLNVRPDQIEYIRDHALVLNVVPNLPLPKNK